LASIKFQASFRSIENDLEQRPPSFKSWAWNAGNEIKVRAFIQGDMVNQIGMAYTWGIPPGPRLEKSSWVGHP